MLRPILNVALVEERPLLEAAVEELWGAGNGMYDLVQKVRYGNVAGAGRDAASDDTSFSDRRERIMKERMSIVNSLKIFMGWTNQIEGAEIANDLRRVAQIEGVDRGWGYDRCLKSNTRTNLVVQFFDNKRRGSATKLAVLALTANIMNPCISKVWVLYENDADRAILNESLGRIFFGGVPAELEGKVHHVMLGKRMTFTDVFSFASLHIGDDEIVIVSNNDIVFGHTLSYLFEKAGTKTKTNDDSFLKNELFALSRWTSPSFLHHSDVQAWSKDERYYRDIAAVLLEEPKDGKITVFDETIFHSRIDSQDTWIFKGKISDIIVSLSHFYQGLPRCDQRLVSIFRESGWKVSNPSVALVGIHIEDSGLFDMTGDERGKDNKDKESNEYDTTKNVHGTYENVLISDKWNWRK